MANAAKISISVAEPELLAWAKKRAERRGVSLSAVFTEAVRFERQLEARKRFLESLGPEGRATPDEMAAIRADWEAQATPAKRATKRRRARATKP